ncbi:hypothetical protein FA13DRAFT_1801189 [Coprinellus micaceus]|uniref:Nephrocystin 3-like N-terminal domain-containing protein n=1 Tax=Coprinellus micaceus TaxID=71717 RepID=A0A4Y7SEJ9_COPMI|nr:hypothetical protein FA13DRAFT_1801189 [Coprinellus micaceus]
MPLFRPLADKVETFVKRFRRGGKRESPSHRGGGHDQRAQTAGPPSPPNPAAAQRERHVRRQRPPARSTPMPMVAPANISHSRGEKRAPNTRSVTPHSKSHTPIPMVGPPASISANPKHPRPVEKSLPPIPKALPSIPSPQPPPHHPPATTHFEGAHGFHIEHQHLSSVQISGTSKTLFEYLDPYIAHGAAHDASERSGAPTCAPETRVVVQQEIMTWMRRGDGEPESKYMMWLSGPAGAGKTAIAGSIAEICRNERLLAGSFFFSSFSGSTARHSKRGFVATLAHQLSQHDSLHRFKEHLILAIERFADVFHKNLKEQAEQLLIGPFQAIWDQCGKRGWPSVIVVDAVEEVELEKHDDAGRQQHEEAQLEILNVLFTLSQSPVFPFRILVVSRPEPIITNFFSTTAHPSTIKLFLDSKYNPDADIARFLELGFTNPLWPDQPALDKLVDMSSGQFVVPTTIIRYIASGLPQRRLKHVLGLDLAGIGTENPFAVLDALYRFILKRNQGHDYDPYTVVMWIWCITRGLRTSAPQASAQFWRQFLENEEGELTHCMAPITSLVFVPPPEDTSSPITVYHKSLIDFLSSPNRCGDLYADRATHDSFVADRIVKILINKGPVVPPSSPPGDPHGFLKTILSFTLLQNCGQDSTKLASVQSLLNILGFLEQ